MLVGCVVVVMPWHLLIAVVLALLASSVALLAFARPTRYEREKDRPDDAVTDGSSSSVSVQIVVLGDIGHSPRMQYHALSIAKHGGRVSVIGYEKSAPNPELLSHPSISIVPLSGPPAFLQTSNKYLFPFLALLKVFHQTWCLWTALAYRTTAARWMLVQNPPAAPTLAVAQLACYLRSSRLVVDWHNFGYSILALKLGKRHPIVSVMKRYETAFCHAATAHFCVSDAMAKVLRDEMRIKAPVLALHDRPAAVFQPMRLETERHTFLASLSETAQLADEIMAGRCRLLVSSTSWTADEDFSILLDALCRYSAAASERHDLPSLLVIITGKGPRKEFYLSRVSTLTEAGKLAKVTIKTAWLAPQDYAGLLAASCLGVSLHTSSSDVDLPMKVVDMFGAGLPVVGWNQYASWPELVTEGVNGLGFGTSEELASHLVDLFEFSNTSTLKKIRDGALLESESRWDDQWDPVAGRLLELTS